MGAQAPRCRRGWLGARDAARDRTLRQADCVTQSRTSPQADSCRRTGVAAARVSRPRARARSSVGRLVDASPSWSSPRQRRAKRAQRTRGVTLARAGSRPIAVPERAARAPRPAATPARSAQPHSRAPGQPVNVRQGTRPSLCDTIRTGADLTAGPGGPRELRGRSAADPDARPAPPPRRRPRRAAASDPVRGEPSSNADSARGAQTALNWPGDRPMAG